ncbi:MAG: YggT family protein [Actinobacteria bacterium]|nr:YggT family protein [Actinomycetota bacterium]
MVVGSIDIGCLIVFAVAAYANVLFLYIIVTLLQSLAGLRIPDWLRPAVNFVYDLCEPFLRVFRGFMPSLSMGGMGLDLSPIIAFLVLFIVRSILANVLCHV